MNILSGFFVMDGDGNNDAVNLINQKSAEWIFWGFFIYNIIWKQCFWCQKLENIITYHKLFLWLSFFPLKKSHNYIKKNTGKNILYDETKLWVKISFWYQTHEAIYSYQEKLPATLWPYYISLK